MSDIGICKYCKHIDKDIIEKPCLHCDANLGAFEFDLSKHDAKIKADVIDDDRALLLAYICKKYHIPLSDMNVTVDEWEEMKEKKNDG